MTSPDVNVGSIIARVALDTTGLKRGEADATSALKRTSTGMQQTATQAEKVQKKVNDASVAIKRNTDVQVDAIRRQSSEQNRANRESTRSGASRGAVAGVIAGQLITNGIGSIGDGKGGARDIASTALGGALAGGSIGSIIGPEGTAAGAVIGGAAAGGATLLNKHISDVKKANQAQIDITNHMAEATHAVNVELARQAQYTDDLGRAQLRTVDATAKLRQAQADLSNPDARSREAGIVGPLVGGAFDEHQRMTQGDTGKAVDRLASANERAQRAQDRVDRLRAGTGGASQSSVLSAQASVASAEKSLAHVHGDRTAAVLRLQAAESRLAELRKKGGTDTRALASAERDLESARKKADAAQAAVTKAGLPAALDPSTLLRRQAVKTSDVQALDKDTRALVKKGLAAPVIEELLRTEKDAPGTIHKVASTISKAQVQAFNAQQAAMQKAADDLVRAPLDRAYQDAKRMSERRAKELAAQTKAAWAAALNGGPASPNISPLLALPGAKGQHTTDPLLTSLFPQTRSGPKNDPDVTFTGPVTIVTNTAKGILADTHTRVNALSRQ